ncbi:hypothetical protein HKD37_15G043569 [Glycine soja]
MFLSMKNTIFPLSSSPNATQTLTPSSPPPTTTGGHHEPPLLTYEPPHHEEHCNRSGILRILLKNSMDKTSSILHFVASLR